MSDSTRPADLAADTAVTRLAKAPGWYTATLPDSWNFLTPSGGVLMTVALRAMLTELDDPELQPVSANTLFMSPVPDGPVEIRVEVLRRGAAAAQLRAALSSTVLPGPGLEVSATFARRRTGPEFTDAAPPDVAPPDAGGRSARARDGVVPRFFHNLETALALGSPWWEDDWEAGPARIARWMRYRVPQRLPDGRLDPLAIPPIADTMPPAVVQRLGPEHPPFHAPSLDLTVHFLEASTAEWLLVHVRSRRAGGGYATAEIEVWDPDRRLLAYGAQTMMIRRIPPNWPGRGRDREPLRP